MNKKVRVENENGMALIVVLMVLVLFSVLTFSLIYLTANNSKITRGERDDQAVFYIAEAGINSRLDKIQHLISNDPLLSTIDKEEDYYNKLDEIMATVINDELTLSSDNKDFDLSFGNSVKSFSIVKPNNYDSRGKYIIKSKGVIGSKIRVLQLEIEIPFETPTSSEDGGSKPGTSGGSNSGNIEIGKPVISSPDGVAAFVKEKISMSGGAEITGGVGTNKNGLNTISLTGGASVSGEIYVPKGSESSAVSKQNGIKTEEPTGIRDPAIMELPEFPIFPTYPMPPNTTVGDQYNKKEVIKDGGLYVDNWLTKEYTLKMDKDISLTTIKLNEDNTLTIDVGSSDRIIVVDNLDVTNGHIKIVGTGKITFVVKNNITMGAGSTINNNGPLDKVGVYLEKSSDPKKPKEVNLGGDQKIFGSLYAEDANININSGGGFQGNILTGGENVTISGGGSAYSSVVLAPNADVHLNGGGSVKGSVYAKSLTMDGGTKIIYEKPTIETGPFDPTSPENPEENDKDEVSNTPDVIKSNTIEISSSQYN